MRDSIVFCVHVIIVGGRWWRKVYFPAEIEAEGREEGTQVDGCTYVQRG